MPWWSARVQIEDEEASTLLRSNGADHEVMIFSHRKAGECCRKQRRDRNGNWFEQSARCGLADLRLLARPERSRVFATGRVNTNLLAVFGDEIPVAEPVTCCAAPITRGVLVFGLAQFRRAVAGIGGVMERL